MTIKPFGTMPDILINIDSRDYANYRTLVDYVSPNEVQWYSMVTKEVIPAKLRSKKTAKDLVLYTVSDIVIPHQEVTRTQVDTDARKDPMKVYAIYQEMCARYSNDSELGYDEELVNNAINKMHCWCHSHPFTDNPKPSGQDDNQFEDWVIENQINQHIDTPMVALIFGKTQKIHARVYDPEYSDTFWDDQSVNIVFTADNTVQKYIEDAIENKIKEAPKPVFNKGFKNWTPGSFSSKATSQTTYNSNIKFASNHKPAKPKLTDEEKANKMFVNKWANDSKTWAAFVDEINSGRQVESSIHELIDFVSDHWITTPEELFAFTIALTVNVDTIEQYEKVQMDSACFVPSDAYPLIEEHFATHIVDSQLIKSAITFAKKICSSAATASSIYSAKEKYYTEMEDQLRVEYPATSFESDLPFEDWMDFYPAVRN